MSERSARPRVLLIGTDGRSTAQLAASLADAGHSVTSTTDPAEALRSTHAADWDAVLIEIEPIEAALNLVRQMHSASAELATIVLSADTSAATIRAGFDEGAYSWLVAPAPLELVAAAIRQARERRLLRGPATAALRPLGLSSADAHMMNNQLAGIMGLTQLHLIDEALPEDLRADFTMIMDGARAIADVLKQVRSAQASEPSQPKPDGTGSALDHV